MLRRSTIALGAALLALTLALPALAGHGKNAPHKKAPSAHALCMQSVAQTGHTFHQQQVAARKAFEAQRKAAKKAFHAQEKAARLAFNQLHPNPTVADLKAFHAQQKAARKTFHDQEAAATEGVPRPAGEQQNKAFHAQQEAAKKAC